jgi:phosphopentomutase
MSDSCPKAIADADRCIQSICSSLSEDTTVIITSDHGGHDHINPVIEIMY